MDGSAFGQPGIRNNDLHRETFSYRTMIRRSRSISVLQATHDSPTLSKLADLATESSARLRAIQPLIPVLLRPAVKAGPIEGTTWCLLVANSAVASKMRQLLPALEAHLRSAGWEVNSIRLKVQMATYS
jgi:hypothetical protein